MRLNSRRPLRAFARQLAAVSFSVQHSDRPWQLPVAAALTCGFPMVVGALAKLPRAGSLGAVAGLAFLYLPSVRSQQSIPIVMAAAFGMVLSYAIGLAGSTSSIVAAVLIGCVAAAAMLFCKALGLVPPGPLFMVIAGAIGAFSPVSLSSALQNIGYFAVGCIWSCVVAVAYSVCFCRPQVLAFTRYFPGTTVRSALTDSILIGFFVGASLALALMLDLAMAYWVPVSCVAVIQGATLTVSLNRHLHRIVGTFVGLGLTWLLLPELASMWAAAAAATLLTFMVETAVVRHYAFAAVFFTPLAILLAEIGKSSSVGVSLLMEARMIDTIVGTLIGLCGAILLHSMRVRAYVRRVVVGIRHIKACLWRSRLCGRLNK